jgi:glycosyltransferase involved in cell wall biosynthesis/predicted glycosyltransferase/SAM-dependent methyltransferase
VKIAFHAINGVGLGHLTRVTAIAEEVRALHPDVAILVLTNARDTSMLTRGGFDFVRLPPRLAEPHADPDRVRVALPAPLEHAALAAALDAFRPDLVVFDTHAPAALVHHAARIGARAALVQRALRPAELAAFFASRAAASFDRIIVPHEPGEVNLDAAAHLPVVVTGPIVRALRTKLPRGARVPAVVMMNGGGGQPVHARRFLRAAADAHILARARLPRLTTLLVAGPYGEVGEDLRGIPGLTVVGSCAELPALLSRAKVVVSHAGYNSVAELRALEVPTILVPAYRRAEDQAARAKRLVLAGAAVTARPRARAIADQLEALLTSPSARRAMVAAHRRHPLVAGNRAAAEAIVRPVRVGPRVRRVVLVAHEFPPRVGGMETVALALAVGLVERGVDVRVYATRHLGPEIPEMPAGTVRRLYAPGVDLWGDLLITLEALLTDAPDVIHLCNAGLGPWVPALRAAFPAVVTVNVHGNDLLAPWPQHGGDPAATRAAQIAGLSAAHAVVAVSTFSARAAAAAGVRRAKIGVLENGVDGARFTARPHGPADAELAARLGIAPDDEVVLTVSRLAPRKGHAVALRALARLRRERPRALYVYTGENPRLGAELHALAIDLGVGDRVRAVGFVSDDDLPALYRLARVFVLLSDSGPTDVEGFGVALLEAAASGLPVVATRAGGMPEALVEGSTGLLVAPRDARAAARAVSGLLADPAEARAMGERGRARTLARFALAARTVRVVDRWNVLLAAGASLRPLGPTWGAAFAGEVAAAASPRTVGAREALRTVTTGVGLVRLAQEDGIARRAVAARRRATFARIVAQGGVVRLRARGSGASLLVEALADCLALGHEPQIETTLRRFVTPEVRAHVLPQVRGANLVHGVPSEDAPLLMRRLSSLPDDAFAKIRKLSVHVSNDFLAGSPLAHAAVAEAQALRRLLSEYGVKVALPREIALDVEAESGKRARDVVSYQQALCSRRAAAAWVPRTLREALVDQAARASSAPPLVVDFGCGVAVALLGIAATAARAGIEVRALGLDRGFSGPHQGDYFPGDEDLLRRVLARHTARIGELGGAALPSVRRADLDRAPWPLAAGSVALAVSRAMIMYLSDKLRFIERVYDSLEEGGVALLHVDQLRAGTRELQRIALQGATIEDLLAEQRSRGVEIHGQGNFVVAMRRSRMPLAFPFRLVRSHPMIERGIEEDPWGVVAHYEPATGAVKHRTACMRAGATVREVAAPRAVATLQAIATPRKASGDPRAPAAGAGVHCPCCGGDFEAFLPYGLRPRPGAQCPRCRSLERHRQLALYLRERTPLFASPLRLLHVAPEPALERIFRAHRDLDYVNLDLCSPLADVRMDLTRLTFDAETFDVVLAVHVLEHVEDDRRAMAEIFRVIKPGGWAVLQVPVDEWRARTLEDPAVITPADRERVFGQSDHVRCYGRDYRERLEGAGFVVEVDDYASRLPLEEARRFGLERSEKIYRCVKPR